MKKNEFTQWYFYSFAIVLIFFTFSCNPVKKETIDLKTEKNAVEEVIHNSIGWAVEKDFELLKNTLVNDSSLLMVNPGNSIVIGFNEFMKIFPFWENPDFKAIGHEIRDLNINFSHNADVAWFYCILDDRNEWKGEPANWLNTRWTGVLEKIEGQWKIRQQHFSFAAE